MTINRTPEEQAERERLREEARQKLEAEQNPTLRKHLKRVLFFVLNGA